MLLVNSEIVLTSDQWFSNIFSGTFTVMMTKLHVLIYFYF